MKRKPHARPVNPPTDESALLLVVWAIVFAILFIAAVLIVSALGY